MRILDFPQFPQTYEYDCGAKALQSVFVYYGINDREGVLMKELKTSKKGTSVKSIETAAKKRGFKIDAQKMEIIDLKKYIDKKIPIILPLQAWGEKKNGKMIGPMDIMLSQ